MLWRIIFMRLWVKMISIGSMRYSCGVESPTFRFLLLDDEPISFLRVLNSPELLSKILWVDGVMMKIAKYYTPTPMSLSGILQLNSRWIMINQFGIVLSDSLVQSVEQFLGMLDVLVLRLSPILLRQGYMICRSEESWFSRKRICNSPIDTHISRIILTYFWLVLILISQKNEKNIILILIISILENTNNLMGIVAGVFSKIHQEKYQHEHWSNQ